LEGPESDICPGVRLHHADEAGRDLLRVLRHDIPQICVEAVRAGSQDGELRATLSAVLEEDLGVEHLIRKRRPEGIGKCLPGPKRRPVLCHELADLSLRDLYLFVIGVDIVEDIHQQLELEAWREDARLRSILAIDRDDPSVCQRRSAIYAKELAHAPIGHVNKRRRENGIDDHQPTKDAQRDVGKGASEAIWNDWRNNECQKRAEYDPKKQTRHLGIPSIDKIGSLAPFCTYSLKNNPYRRLGG